MAVVWGTCAGSCHCTLPARACGKRGSPLGEGKFALILSTRTICATQVGLSGGGAAAVLADPSASRRSGR